MSEKITLIIDNIITPYEVARYNAINDVLHGKLEVWFLSETDINRNWKEFPKINFNYKFLNDSPLRLVGPDTHTFHTNLGIYGVLETTKKNLARVVICGWDSLSYWQTARFCKKNSIPYILWSGSTAYEKSWRRSVFMPIIKWIVNGASEYIAYGTRAQDFLESLGVDKGKISKFINSVDIDYFIAESDKMRLKRSKIRNKFGFDDDDSVYLFVGQLIERKGIEELLNAFSRLPQENSKLLIVGSGKLEHFVTRHLNADKQNKIVHIKHLEYHQLPEYYVASDCLILPSKEEVWGLVVNEALASGIPAIVSNAVGAGEDLILEGKTGLSIELDNEKALIQAMMNIAEMPFSIKKLQEVALKTHPRIMAEKVFRKFS